MHTRHKARHALDETIFNLPDLPDSSLVLLLSPLLGLCLGGGARQNAYTAQSSSIYCTVLQSCGGSTVKMALLSLQITIRSNLVRACL